MQKTQPVAKHGIFFLVPALLLLLGACDTVQMRINRQADLFRLLPPIHQELIRQGQIKVDFTAQEVQMAGGSPNHTATGESAAGPEETWIFTRLWTETRFRTVRRYDNKSQLWESVQEPEYIHRELIDKTVSFVNGRVTAWTVFDDSAPYYPTYPEPY